MEIYDVVKKLIGEIEPVGSSHIDKERFENLKVMISLLNKILTDLECIRYDNQNMQEDSIKQCVKCIEDFYKYIAKEF